MNNIAVTKTLVKPNCYLLTSFRRRDDVFEDEFLVDCTISFLYDAGEYAAEWEPKHGPIQVWHKCKKDAIEAKEHYYYDYTDSPGGNWSQLAVSENGLPQAANAGNFDHIFRVLKNWARRG